MASKRRPVSEQLKTAIERSGYSRYRIAKETDVSEAALSRFMSGERGLTLISTDALCDFLKLDLIQRRAPKGR